MKDLIDDLCLDENLESRLEIFTQKNKNKIKKLCNRCHKDFNVLAGCSSLMRLAVCLEYAQTYTFDHYNRLGIPQEYFYSTLKDISIWCENHNNKGLKNYGWIKNHLKCELFKIGRLQYQMFCCKNPTLDYKQLPFKFGDNLIYIHIPQGEKLIYKDCVDSLLSAKKFFEIYFPDFNYQFFFCESWLLFEENFAFMDTSSNILQFQSLFNIVYSATDDRQAIERIFGKRRIAKSNYTESTSLQRSAKAYMLDGNKLGVGIGIINKNDI